MRTKISVVIITKNEENNIGRCLESVKWADEIVIVDSGSTDRTLEICQQYNCKIIETEWLGFGKTKQLAVANATNNLILSIDSDEELSPELQDEIRNKLYTSSFSSAYKIKRLSYYAGKPIHYSDWQNDYPLRIFNKQFGNFNSKTVHEGIKTWQPVKKLKNIMHHHTYPTIATHFDKMRTYGELSAKEKHLAGKTSNPISAGIRAALKFLKMYVIRGGFLDGVEGFLLCKNSAWGVWYKYHRLWELSR